MEHISGGSLQQHLRVRSKKLPEEEVKRIFKQLISAVRYLHSHGQHSGHNIYHRDIKLDNILLDYRKNIKLIDFGFSVSCSPKHKLKMFCGTP
jgi:serine/threonine protein kinase